MLLLSLIEDPATGQRSWLIELDGVCVGRFDSKPEVSEYLRQMGHRLDPDRDWPSDQLL